MSLAAPLTAYCVDGCCCAIGLLIGMPPPAVGSTDKGKAQACVILRASHHDRRAVFVCDNYNKPCHTSRASVSPQAAAPADEYAPKLLVTHPSCCWGRP